MNIYVFIKLWQLEIKKNVIKQPNFNLNFFFFFVFKELKISNDQELM